MSLLCIEHLVLLEIDNRQSMPVSKLIELIDQYSGTHKNLRIASFPGPRGDRELYLIGDRHETHDEYEARMLAELAKAGETRAEEVARQTQLIAQLIQKVDETFEELEIYGIDASEWTLDWLSRPNKKYGNTKPFINVGFDFILEKTIVEDIEETLVCR